MAEDTEYYSVLNEFILANINIFDDVCQENLADIASGGYLYTINGTATLSDAITETFGSDYVNNSVGSTVKNYDGAYYAVHCYESQITNADSSSSNYFAKDTAITAVVAWAISGSWSWQGAVASILASVITTVACNGITYVKYSFTAERSNVTITSTRIVTISVLSDTKYWAGWTRKMYFFKGELGWTHDTGYNYNIKHSDYDDIDGLMETGFYNYIHY